MDNQIILDKIAKLEMEISTLKNAQASGKSLMSKFDAIGDAVRLATEFLVDSFNQISIVKSNDSSLSSPTGKKRGFLVFKQDESGGPTGKRFDRIYVYPDNTDPSNTTPQSNWNQSVMFGYTNLADSTAYSTKAETARITRKDEQEKAMLNPVAGITSEGVILFKNLSANPSQGPRTGMNGLCFVGNVLKYWNGSAWVKVDTP